MSELSDRQNQLMMQLATMLLLWFCTTMRRVAGLFKGWYFRPAPLGNPDQIKLVRGSVGWSACRGLGWGLGPWLWGALARWHIWMREILWRRMGGCANARQTLYCFLPRETYLKFSLQLRAQTKNLAALTLSCIKWISCSLPLSLSFSPFPTPSLPLCLALGGWDTQLFLLSLV